MMALVFIREKKNLHKFLFKSLAVKNTFLKSYNVFAIFEEKAYMCMQIIKLIQ